MRDVHRHPDTGGGYLYLRGVQDLLRLLTHLLFFKGVAGFQDVAAEFLAHLVDGAFRHGAPRGCRVDKVGRIGATGVGEIRDADADQPEPVLAEFAFAVDAFYSTNKLSNCHAVSLRPGDRRFAVTTTNRGSNGNGRRLNKEGEYAGNTSPIHVMEFPASETTGPAEDGDGKKPG